MKNTQLASSKKSSLQAFVATTLAVTTVATGLTAAHAVNSSTTNDTTKIAEQGENGATLGQGLKKYDPEHAKAGLAAASFSGIPGLDVSGWQGTVDWAAQYNNGARFAYVKATEGVNYTSGSFASQYNGSANAGLIRGAYHFALPSQSSGATQARYFVNNGGSWRADGKTLPGLLDFEWNPYTSLGNTCYNMSQAQMRDWLRDFTTTYKNMTGRYPVVYTATIWWNICVGSTTEFNYLPLHLADYSSAINPIMPSGWSTYDIRQYTDSGIFPGDSNVYNGTLSDLKSLAIDPNYQPKGSRSNTASNTTSTGTGSGFSLIGAIGKYYWNNGSYSRFGQATGNEFAVRSGGAVQNFTKSRSIYWSPITGAHDVSWGGAIGSRFADAGYENAWGFPTMAESSFVNNGAKQWFVDPSTGYNTAIYWSAQTGAHTLNGKGAFFGKWASEGNANTYGYPTMDESSFYGGAKITFAKGDSQTSMYWSGNTGAHALNSKGAIWEKWASMNGVLGAGFPTTDETAQNGGAFAFFKNGSSGTAIYWSPTTGAHSLASTGALYWNWLNNGYTQSYGFPTTDEHYDASDGKVHVSFSKGVELTWSASEGVKRVQ